jgi:gentisate 1,2-dioxygenase
MYFSIQGPIEFSGNARVACFIRNNFHGLTSFGGPIENIGRLKYINNCTDTLLISPPRLGDPCLNLLVFPKQTLQDKHTHPSLRLGIVASGSGYCHSKDQKFELEAGTVFSIPPNTIHCFETTNDPLRVIAYHPDSDQGPTDEAHPMINRTILNY